MVYLVCFACIISTVRTKNKPFHHFSNIALTFPGHFRFFIHPLDCLSWVFSRRFTRLLHYYPKRGKQCIQYYWSTILKFLFTLFCHGLLEFYSRFSFRHSRNNVYIRLAECIRCALKEDAVYTSIRNEESIIIDSYLESQQLKRVEIPTDGFCMISAWLPRSFRFEKKAWWFNWGSSGIYASKCKLYPT